MSRTSTRPFPTERIGAWATKLATPVVAPLLELKVLASLTSAVMVGLVASATFLEMRAGRAIREEVDRRQSTVETLRGLKESLRTAESAQRGYLITADPRYLEPYQRALPQIRSQLDELDRSLAGDPSQLAALRQLRQHVADKLVELEDTVKLEKEHHEDVARTVVENGWGKQTMDHALAVIAQMTAAENATLEVDKVRGQQERRRTELVLLLGSLGAFILIILLSMAIRGDVAQRRDALKLIATQAARLGSTNLALAEAHGALQAAFEDRQSAMNRLEMSNRELDEFAKVAAHDLKAPLRGITNLSHWIEEDLAAVMTDTAKEHMRLLRSRALQLEALVNGILDYSREGRLLGKPEQVNIRQIVDDVVALMAPEPSRYSIKLSSDLPVLWTPRIPIERVLTNLLNNAMKYGRADAAIIAVTARDRQQQWEFCVADNGVGLAPRDQGRVFQLFQRVESPMGTEGTGIGLAVVKKLVEGVGGKVWVESEVGQGSRFYFTWPKSVPETGKEAVDGRPKA